MKCKTCATKCFFYLSGFILLTCTTKLDRDSPSGMQNFSDTASQQISESHASLMYVTSSREDTIESNEYRLVLCNAEKELYNSADSVSKFVGDSVGIMHKGKDWYFKIDQKGFVKLFSDTTDEMSSYQVYSYVGRLSTTGHWLMHVTYSESDVFFLVDPTNGNTIPLLGFPSVSPSHKFIISGTADLISGQDENGIQLLLIKNKKIYEVLYKDLKKRGPGEFRWLNDKEIICQEYIIADNQQERQQFTKILIQKK